MTTFIIVVVLLIVAVLIFAATRPDSFHIERSTTIAASAEKVFPLINDFNDWPNWSPWAEKDPEMKTAMSSPASGKGATYTWEGNKQVGAGSMTILESSSPNKICFQLDFVKPFKARNTATFTLDAQGDQTGITWALDGPQPFMGKVMSLFMNMDRMVGNDFETGLTKLKAFAEN